MWIATTFGFFSVVEKPEDRGTRFVTVRARVRDDLVALLDACGRRSKIVRDGLADYRFRARVDRDQLGRALASAVANIDYGNFKDAVKDEQGAERARVYTRVWVDLLDLDPVWARSSPFAPASQEEA